MIKTHWNLTQAIARMMFGDDPIVDQAGDDEVPSRIKDKRLGASFPNRSP